MKTSLTILFFTSILFLTTVIIGQEIPAPLSGGTRAFSMGGISTATNKGIDALSGNPGGLALLDTAQFLIGGRVTLLGNNALETDYYERDEGTDVTTGLGIDPKILNLSVAVPIAFSDFNYPLVGAVGYRSFYDISYRNNFTIENEGRKSEKNENTGGLINTLSLGIATSISEKYSFGISFNMPILSGYKYEDIEEERGDNSVKSESLAEYDISGGSFFQLGGIFNVLPKLSIGVSYILGHEYKLKKGKVKYKRNGEVNSEDDLPDVKYEIPGTYNFGVAYKLKPKILIAAEIQNRPWEDVQINNRDLNNVESGYAYRIGMEYGIYVLYRAGISFERLPITDRDDNPVDITTLTGGIGFRGNNILFDIGAAYEFTSFEKKRRGGKIYDFVKNKLNVYATATYTFDFRVGE